MAMNHKNELIELLGLVHEMRKIQNKLPKVDEDNETRLIVVRSLELEAKVDFSIKRIVSELKNEEIENFVKCPIGISNLGGGEPYGTNINSI